MPKVHFVDWQVPGVSFKDVTVALHVIPLLLPYWSVPNYVSV